jgi:hypothetical protein
MATDNRSREALLNENETLRFRLKKAEEILQAMHSAGVGGCLEAEFSLDSLTESNPKSE